MKEPKNSPEVEAAIIELASQGFNEQETRHFAALAKIATAELLNNLTEGWGELRDVAIKKEREGKAAAANLSMSLSANFDNIDFVDVEIKSGITPFKKGWGCEYHQDLNQPELDFDGEEGPGIVCDEDAGDSRPVRTAK